MQSRSVWKGIIFLTVTQLLIRHVLSAPTCGSSQKQRTDTNGLPICCYTTRCNKSQQFEFCTSDQGYDSCKDCPPGTYTEDTINTADWDIKRDVCVTLPHCNPEEIMVGNTCQCALGKGYYGNRDNCISDLNCKGAGFQLQNDGSCVACDRDHFKPEEGKHGICINKTRCNMDEMETSPGTITTDRTCSRVNISTTTQSVTTVTVPENSTPGVDIPWVVPLIVSFVVLVVVVVAVLCIYKNRNRIPGLKNWLNRPRLYHRADDENHGQQLEPMLPRSNGDTQNGGIEHNEISNGFVLKNGSKHPEKSEGTKTKKDIVNGMQSHDLDQTRLKSLDNSSTDQVSDLSQNSLVLETLNLTSLSGSYIEQERPDPTSQITVDLHSTEAKSGYVTPGNLPTNLFGSLETQEEVFDTPLEKQPNSVDSKVTDRQKKKPIPMVAVPPFARSESRGGTDQCTNNTQVSPELGSTVLSNLASPTTAFGLDVEPAINNDNYKIVANAPYGEYVSPGDMSVNSVNSPHQIEFPDEELQGGSDNITESRPSVSHPSPNGTTMLGNPLLSPESDGSHNSSIPNSSAELPENLDSEDTESIQQPDH